jgi:hypothetical protein
LDAAQRLKINNFATVSASVGSTSSPAVELRLIRNFFAHRNKDTADQIYAYYGTVPPFSLKVENLAGALIVGGSIKLDRWISDFQLMAEVAVQ